MAPGCRFSSRCASLKKKSTFRFFSWWIDKNILLNGFGERESRGEKLVQITDTGAINIEGKKCWLWRKFEPGQAERIERACQIKDALWASDLLLDDGEKFLQPGGFVLVLKRAFP